MQKFVASVMLAFGAFPASACAVHEPFSADNIGGAELVLIGTVTAYDPIPGDAFAALVTVEVEEVLKGRARDSLTLVWVGGMAERPDPVRATGRVLIGAMNGGRIAVTTRIPDLRPDLPSLIQPYCGEAWLQPASPDMVEAARKALE